MQLWLVPVEVRHPHLDEIKMHEYNPFYIPSIRDNAIDYISRILHTYVKIELRNFKYPYIYVLKGFEKYVLETYGIENNF